MKISEAKRQEILDTFEQINTPQGRFYEVDGILYPSVTTILEKTASPKEQERLRKWRHKLNQVQGNNTAATVSSQAKSRGTRLHEAIASQLAGKSQALDDEIIPYWQQAKPILAALSNPRHCEQRVYHPEYQYAGTLDLVADWQGKLALIDWKTSYRTKRLAWLKNPQLQCAAYAKAYEWLYDARIEQTLVIVLTPEQAQLFIFDENEINQHWQEWKDRLNQFYAVERETPSLRTTP